MDQSTRWRAAAQSRFYYWDGGFLALGIANGILPSHSHHAFQIVVAGDAPVGISIDEKPWQDYTSAIILPNVVHGYSPGGNLAAVILVDPDSTPGRALRLTYRKLIDVLPDAAAPDAQAAVRAFWESGGDQRAAPAFVRDIVQKFSRGRSVSRQLDARIAKAIALVRTLDPNAAKASRVAAQVHLSAGRFAHLFTENVGLPFGRYLLWRRLSRAMLVASRGESLSTAAHAAGFADAAHFSRTFVQMIGIAPSQFLRQGEVYEIDPPCDDVPPHDLLASG